MARFRRLRRGGGPRARPASAFAPSENAKGKALSWEYLINAPVPLVLSTLIPTAVRIAGTTQTRFVSLIPVNVLRGVVTLMRIRGQIEIFFNVAELAADFDNWRVHLSIQLTPARNGVVDGSSTLSASNSADQESNRILWQRIYYPRTGSTITAPGALEKHDSNYAGQEVDVKVKRRFDRATWALVLVMDVNEDAEGLHFGTSTLRGLFRSGDAL